MNLRIMQFIKCFDYFCFNYARQELSVCPLPPLLPPFAVALATARGKRILIKIFSISALNLKYVPQSDSRPVPLPLPLSYCVIKPSLEMEMKVRPSPASLPRLDAA